MVSLERTVKGKNVLVTGGAGFIGSHLVNPPIAEGIRQLIIIDNFYQGKAANLTEARCHMPNLRFRIWTPRMIVQFSKLEAVDVVFDLAVIPLPNSIECPKFCFRLATRVLVPSIYALESIPAFYIDLSIYADGPT